MKQNHVNTAKYLLVTQYNACLAQLNDFFTEAEWLLHDKPVRKYDYYYDQIVALGELLSSTLVHFYLTEIGVENKWIDVRDVLRTDENFREAAVDLATTTQAVINAVPANAITITQGFIGCTADNESTTLGREGSDYTAALLANILEAENVTIWKDVEGVMSADPKEFSEAVYLERLSFDEVIEMSYYGAQIIHPKTIQPLQQKNIPLLVKCFLQPALPGTIIHKQRVKQLPPITIIKRNMVLVHLQSKRFDFVDEKTVGFVYHTLAKQGLKPSLVQTGAIGLQFCVEDKPEQLQNVAVVLEDIFNVQVEKDLQLLTVRHYLPNQIQEVLAKYAVVLAQQTPTTFQVVFRG
ncbi:MAG: aspartate kinase [Bacteroidetes bacterium]|nr:MAG: aspartate kinase [Bacteroidota bacterium]